VVAQSDGGVVATGGVSQPLTKITAAGAVDASWGTNLPACDSISRAVASGSSIVVACGHFVSRPSAVPRTWQLWRVTSAGVLDSTFGTGGIVDLPTTLDNVDVAPLPGGAYLTLGHADALPSTTSVPPLVATVYSPTGSELSSTDIDLTVPPAPSDTSGYTWNASLSPTTGGAAAIETLSTTTTSGGPYFFQTMAVQRFDATGAATDPPGPTSFSTVDVEPGGLVELAGGRIATAGTTLTYDFNPYHPTSTFTSWLRVTLPDGSPDPGFASGHDVTLLAPDGSFVRPSGLATTADGSGLLVVGNGAKGGVVFRFDATTGAATAAFGSNGEGNLQLKYVESVTPGGTGLIYAGGSLDGNQAPRTVARFTDVPSS
jgi:hypothetical protein